MVLSANLKKSLIDINLISPGPAWSWQGGGIVGVCREQKSTFASRVPWLSCVMKLIVRGSPELRFHI